MVAIKRRFSLFLLLAAVGASIDDGIQQTGGYGASFVPVTRTSVETEDFGDSGTVAAPQSSPECWKSAMMVFRESRDNHLHDDTAATFCRIMPEEHQKMLALLIAQCHLEDLGKPLFKDPNISSNSCLIQRRGKDASSVPETSPPDRDLQWCLKHLSDAAIHAYTHYVSYVQQLCMRLTQELVMTYQRQVQLELAERFSNISLQSIEQLEALSALTDTLSQSLQDQLERHQKMLKEKLEAHMDGLLRDYLDEIEQQHEKMKEQNIEMNILSNAIAQVMKIMKPLFALESLVSAAMEGYTWITCALHLMVTLNVIWLATKPQRCQSVRSYLFGIVLAEAAAEAALGICVQNGVVAENERLKKITELRRLTLFFESSLYVLGVIFSLLPRQQSQNENQQKCGSYNHEISEALQRRQETLLNELEGRIDRLREDRRTSFVERQLQPQMTPGHYVTHQITPPLQHRESNPDKNSQSQHLVSWQHVGNGGDFARYQTTRPGSMEQQDVNMTRSTVRGQQCQDEMMLRLQHRQATTGAIPTWNQNHEGLHAIAIRTPMMCPASAKPPSFQPVSAEMEAHVKAISRKRSADAVKKEEGEVEVDSKRLKS